LVASKARCLVGFAMVKFWFHRSKAGFDFPKALAISYLGKGLTEILVETGKSFRSMIAAVFVSTFVELFFGRKYMLTFALFMRLI
jgi:hypothetical protein